MLVKEIWGKQILCLFHLHIWLSLYISGCVVGLKTYVCNHPFPPINNYKKYIALLCLTDILN